MAAKPKNMNEWLAYARSMVDRRAKQMEPYAHGMDVLLQQSVDKTALIHRMSWKGPYGSQWLGRVRVTEHRNALNAILYWKGADGYEAVDVKPAGICFHYAPALFHAYAGRGPARTDVEAVEAYFHDNFHLTVEREEDAPTPDGHYAGINKEGLVFGQMHGDLISLNEFVHRADITAELAPLVKKLDLYHHLQDLPLDHVKQMRAQLEQTLATLQLGGTLGEA